MGSNETVMTKRETRDRYAEIARLEDALLATSPADAPTRKRLAKALERALRRVPQILDTPRGRSLFAMAAEILEDWKSAVEHRKIQIAYIAFMREIAQTESVIARRLILRDYPPKAFAAAYDQLAVDYIRVGDRNGAIQARAMSRHWHRNR